MTLTPPTYFQGVMTHATQGSTPLYCSLASGDRLEGEFMLYYVPVLQGHVYSSEVCR